MSYVSGSTRGSTPIPFTAPPFYVPCTSSASPIKKTPFAPQREREDVRQAREEFEQEQESLPAEKLIFIDESGCHPGIGPRRGWSQEGQPLCGPEQAYACKQHLSIIGAIGVDGLIARATVKGGVGSREFRRFIEQQLVPKLRPGNIVCMDNPKAHKTKGGERTHRSGWPRSVTSSFARTSLSWRNGGTATAAIR